MAQTVVHNTFEIGEVDYDPYKCSVTHSPVLTQLNLEELRLEELWAVFFLKASLGGREGGRKIPACCVLAAACSESSGEGETFPFVEADQKAHEGRVCK